MSARPGIYALLALLAVAPAASAQDTGRAEADRRFQEGVELFAEGHYGDALQAFQASRSYRETGTVVYNIANCLRALARRVEAIEAYRRFMVIRGDRLTAEDRRDAEDIIASLLAGVVELRVRTDPPDAEILVNGRVMREQPMLVDVGTEIAAEARKEGYRPARTTTRLNAPGPLELMLSLVRLEVTPSAAAATTTTQEPVERVAPAAATTPTASEEPSDESGGSVLPWILAGAAAVAVGAGVGVYLLTSESEPAVTWRVTTP